MSDNRKYYYLKLKENYFDDDSIVLLEQVRTLDKHRLKEKMGRLDAKSMSMVDQALSVSFGLGERPRTT